MISLLHLNDRPALPALLRYGIAVLATLAAGVSYERFAFLHSSLLLPFFAAVLVSSWIGGLGPSVVAAIGSTILLSLVQVVSHGMLGMPLEGHNWWKPILFLGVCGLFLWQISGQQSARARAEELGRWLYTTLGSIGDAVIATDEDGRIAFMNEVAARLTGWPIDEARGRPLGDVFRLVHQNKRSALESSGTRAMRAGRTAGPTTSALLIDRAGKEIAVEDTAAPIRSRSGETLGVVLAFRDVGPKREAEQKAWFLAHASLRLAESLDYRQTLDTIAELAVPDIADWCAIDLLEESGEITQAAIAHRDPEKIPWVRELNRQFPTSKDAPTGAPKVIRTGTPELFSDITDEVLTQAVKDPELLRIIRGLGLRSSMVVPLRERERILGAMTLVSSTPGRHYTGADLLLAQELAARAALAVDKARLLRETQEARKDAERSSIAKDEFLATVSHELRTPLNAILGWAKLLRSGRFPATRLGHGLEVIERNALSQVRLIEDLLDISRIVSGKMRLEIRPVQLAQIVADCVESARPTAEAKEVRLQSELAADLPPLMVDSARLGQVVWNLISNALKFTPRGGLITVRLFAEGPHALIEVADSGQGIAPEFLPRVFDRFSQADSTRTRTYGGLGLGLAIVRYITEQHGGHVSADSAGPNHGSLFRVELPMRPPAVVSERPAPPKPPAVADSPAPSPLAGVKILAVDDEADARELIAMELSQFGAEVRLAASAEEAIATLRSFRPDVLVSDIGMPREDGLALIHRVRALSTSEGGAVPALALTGYARAEDRQEALANGFQSYLPKPVEPAVLAAEIGQLLSPR